MQNFGCLLQLVKLIPRQPKKLNIKKRSVGEPLAKFWLLSSVAPPLLDLPKVVKSGLKQNRARWVNPLQNYSCSLQLVKLIPRQPNKLNIKKISVGEPLAKFQLLYSVAPPLLGCLRRPRAATLIKLV